jgi:hypothetical protein
MKEVIILEGTDINKNIALERFRIDPLSEMTTPPVFCKIGESPTMTAGNFSLINGKAKSGKTFLLGSIVASMVNNSKQVDIITGCLPDAKRNVLYFDTEQSTYHATRTIKRICKLINSPSPENLFAYGLRPLTPAERLTAIEEVISMTANLGAVAIDGVRDLLTMGINDEAEATSLTSKFLKWTSDHDMHMVLLLHQNKTDLNARGHIGTEILNKAETTLSVSKDPKTNIFVVSCEYSRDIAFDNFGFSIDNGSILPSELPGQEQLKAKNPQSINEQEHFKALDSIFKGKKRIDGTDLNLSIRAEFNNAFGENHCRTFIFHYEQKNWIDKIRLGRNVFYEYKRAIF